MKRREDLFVALEIFNTGFSDHIEKCLIAKWGDGWLEEIKPYSQKPINIDKDGKLDCDFGQLVWLFSNNSLKEDFGIDGLPFLKNWANILRGFRNLLSHHKPIDEEQYIVSLYGMKCIAEIFDDISCLEQLQSLSKQAKDQQGNTENNADLSPESTNVKAEEKLEEEKIETPVIDREKKIMGPIKLLSVSEGTRGKNRAILLKFNVGGEEKEVGCSFPQGYEDRQKKCESLVDKLVNVHWANDNFTFENGWFSDISEYQDIKEKMATSHLTRLPVRDNSNVIWVDHKIISVKLVAGTDLVNYWDFPMWKITTDKGEYIQAASNVPSEDIRPGSMVKANVTESKGYQWLNIQKTIEDDLDDEIPF